MSDDEPPPLVDDDEDDEDYGLGPRPFATTAASATQRGANGAFRSGDDVMRPLADEETDEDSSYIPSGDEDNGSRAIVEEVTEDDDEEYEEVGSEVAGDMDDDLDPMPGLINDDDLDDDMPDLVDDDDDKGAPVVAARAKRPAASQAQRGGLEIKRGRQ